jgi:hypothetical protein
MADWQITHVRRGATGGVTHVGAQSRWELAESEVVQHIESGGDTFFVMCPQRAEVIVKAGARRPYLATTADTWTSKSLDVLPEL